MKPSGRSVLVFFSFLCPLVQTLQDEDCEGSFACLMKRIDELNAEKKTVMKLGYEEYESKMEYLDESFRSGLDFALRDDPEQEDVMTRYEEAQDLFENYEKGKATRNQEGEEFLESANERLESLKNSVLTEKN